MNFKRKFKISFCSALIITLFLSILSFAKTSDEVRKDVLRLHVIANSDTEADQKLKLKVRDAVLREGAEIFDGSVNVKNAVERIMPQIDDIKKAAEAVIRENGYDYKVEVKLNREYFTTRTYDNVTLPAGKYLALRVIIGRGAGHNWWCVMFPPLCLPAANKREEIEDVLSGREVMLVEKNPKYEIRFKVVEIFEDIKMRINEKR